jgi:hypothetical protein
MASRATAVLLFLLLLTHGCSHPGSQSNHRIAGAPPQVLAVYEAWFGHPRHIKISYSSHDPEVIRKQILQAKAMGITGFVVDWYGYREPFIDRSYALMQGIAAEENFHVAMMYDEPEDEEGATDEAIEDFKLFDKTYLAADAQGRQAYLTYNNRPVIFIFPKQHTDWNRVRAEVNKWKSPPVLIDEYPPPAKYLSAIDGYYVWIHPIRNSDGSNWGEQYLKDFYAAMETKYPDKITVGGAWSSFDDSKASWGLNRHISPRCGKTFTDTSNLARQYYSSGNPMPFVLVETWNDYEEGTAVEPGIPTCGAKPQPPASN